MSRVRSALAVTLATILLGACRGAATEVETIPRLVLVDEHHNNGHTVRTTYSGLAAALEAAGFVVRGWDGPFTPALLDSASLLVTSNALAASNVDDWSLPTPSAFTAAEIETVHQWVMTGGALLLIADHMPFPGAARKLAAAFDIALSNGFAFDTLQLALPHPCLLPDQVHIFRRSDGTLADHPITNGRNQTERVDSVATFTGHAFDPDRTLDPLLSFGPNAVSIETAEAWTFHRDTTVVPVAGWRQGGVREMGAGRLAILGEAAMFTTQECWNNGTQAMGWELPAAHQNRLLLVNLVRWLTRTL